jgi:hypothetical protein
MILFDKSLYGAFPVPFNECVYQLLNEHIDQLVSGAILLFVDIEFLPFL